MIKDVELFLLKNEESVLFNALHVSCRFGRHETWHSFLLMGNRALADHGPRL